MSTYCARTYCALYCTRRSSDTTLFNPLYLPICYEAGVLTIEQMGQLRLREVTSLT